LLYQAQAVERNSLTSTRSSSDVGLVCATAFIMSHGAAKARLNEFNSSDPTKERALGSEISYVQQCS